MTPRPDWAEHAVSIVVIAGGAISFLVVVSTGLASHVFRQLLNAIKKLDDTLEKLFSKFDDHERRLSTLEGSHQARTKMNMTCEVDE